MSKCLICNEDFSEEFTLPKVLPCGHTSCARCIFERSQTYKAFVCPECGITIRDFNVLSRLPTNGALIKCIQQMKMQKAQHSSPSSFFSHPGSNPFMATRDNTINFSPSHDNFFTHSPSHGHHHNPNDSFNFDNFRAFFEQGTAPRDRTYQRSFTDPRKSRSRTPPRRINGIEYSEKGVFREKSPRSNNPTPFPSSSPSKAVDTCDMKMCNYPKMVIKGSKVPFCSFHFNQLNKNGAFGSTNPMNLSDISSNLSHSPGFHGYRSANTSVMSAPHSSQSMLAQLNMMSNSFDYTPIPSQSHSYGGSTGRPKPQFGKPSALNDLMGFYNETPQSSQESGNSGGGFENPNASQNAYKGIGMTNSSVFSGFGTQGSQGSHQGSLNTSMTFGKNGWQNVEPKVPFPEIKEKKPKNLQLENKCILPDCQNQRLVIHGFTYPVCGKKCFRRWEETSKQGFDWSRTGF